MKCTVFPMVLTKWMQWFKSLPLDTKSKNKQCREYDTINVKYYIQCSYNAFEMKSHLCLVYNGIEL